MFDVVKKTSFSDEAIPGIKSWDSHIVSALIISDSNLNWFYTLLELIKIKSKQTHEIKSREIIKLFPSIDKKTKSDIWMSLQKVPIIIEDPKIHSGGSGITLNPNNTFSFRFRDKTRIIERNNILSEIFEKVILNNILEFIIHDSPLIKLDYAKEIISGCPPQSEEINFKNIYKKRFQGKDIKIEKKIEIASLLTVRQISAFFEMVDPEIHKQKQQDLVENKYYFRSYYDYLLDIADEALKVDRIFDKGDTQSLSVIRESSSSISTLIHPHINDSVNQEITQIDSRESIFIQASDWASGIARKIYEDGGCKQLKKIFNTIIVNGRVC